LNYIEKIGPEGNFDGNKQAVLDAIALYAKGPFSKDLAQDGYLDIIYNAGEPKAGGYSISWDGLPRNASFGRVEADTVFAHEFGHTTYGGGYNDHPGTDLGGGLGNVISFSVVVKKPNLQSLRSMHTLIKQIPKRPRLCPV
jgi:hypothetical protein